MLYIGMNFSDHLLAWRRFRALTQTALAGAARIPQPNIAALEAGRLEPKLSTLRRLAHALGITPGRLLDERPPQQSWSRHRIDALVRSAAKGKKSSGTLSTDRLGRALRVVAASKLAASGHPVALKGRTGERLIKQLRADLGPAVWAAVVRRLDKYV